MASVPSKKDKANTQETQGIRLVIDGSSMKTSYANAFQTTYSAGEFLLKYGVGQAAEQNGEAVFAVSLERLVGMSPANAKRLALNLLQTLNEYEQKYGEIVLE